jgi:hypothetical protein
MSVILNRVVLFLSVAAAVAAGSSRKSFAGDFPVDVVTVADFWPNPAALGETSTAYIQARPDAGEVYEELGDPTSMGCNFSPTTWMADRASDEYGACNACEISFDKYYPYPDMLKDGTPFYGVYVHATPSVGGWWAVQIDAAAWMYYENNDFTAWGYGSTFENADQPGPDLLVVQLTGVEDVAARPNNPLALNDTFMNQDGVVGVLNNWSLRYKEYVVPEDAQCISWENKVQGAGNGTYAKLGDGVIYIQSGIAKGDYNVRAYLNREDPLGTLPKVSSPGSREVQAGTLKCTSLAVVRESADYTRPAGTVHFTPPALVDANMLKVTGVLEWDGAPQPSNIKQGIIQGGVFNWEERYPAASMSAVWDNPNAPAGSVSIPYTSELFYTPALVPTELNDAPTPLGHYLYNTETSKVIGPAGVSITDLPAASNPSITFTYPHQTNGIITVRWDVSKEVLNFDFTDYLVAEVTTSQGRQFEPKKKVSWQLHYDSTGTDTSAKCKAVGPASDPTKPPDGSVTSSDTILKAPMQNGPIVNYPKP